MDLSGRTTPLQARAAASLPAIVYHPFQQETFKAVWSLIERLRACRSAADYLGFQVDLYRCLMTAESRQALATRNVKRERRGSAALETAPSGSWEIEQVVADRAARQLRAVGDALAWRFFRFDRRYIIAFAQNDPPGPMLGKTGLEAELREVEGLWTNEGRLALLHGLTDCCRIADLTIGNMWLREATLGSRNDSAYTLREVKSSSRRRPGKGQMSRMRMLVDALNHDAPVLGPDGRPRQLFRSARPLVTHLEAVGKCAAQALDTGCCSIPVADQWIVTAGAVAGIDHPLDHERLLHRRDQARGVAMNLAGLAHASQLLQLSSTDNVGRSPGIAPWPLFPFPPKVCAALTCDWLILESVVAVDQLRSALSQAGFSVVYELSPHPPTPVGDEPVIAGRIGANVVSINASAVSQILTEHLDLGHLAEALKEWLAGEFLGGTGIVTFSDEGNVWR